MGRSNRFSSTVSRGFISSIILNDPLFPIKKCKLPGYGYGYRSTRFLKSQDLDTTGKWQVQKGIQIFLQLVKKIELRIKTIDESQEWNYKL